jgi:hypothetical protein
MNHAFGILMTFRGRLTECCAIVAAASVACTGCNTDSTRVEDDVTSAGDSGSGGSGGSGGEGEMPNFEQCPTPSGAAESSATPNGNLGCLGGGERGTHEGRVSAVSADRVDVTTSEGTYTFAWSGPALDTAFAIDDVVQLVGPISYGYGLFSHIDRSELRSARATAIVMAGVAVVSMGLEPGSSQTLDDVPPLAPELVYRLVSCCNRSIDPSVQCDYSALEARLDGQSVAIAHATTGEIGPWSITNLRSLYLDSLVVVSYESTWDLQVTLLGPPTPPSADGGL